MTAAVTGERGEELRVRADELLATARAQVGPRLRELVENRLAAVAAEARYHLGWRDEQGRPVARGGGKAVRPALCLAAAAAVGGSAERAEAPAVAVQLVHEFSLLHDDIVDGDRTRRGRPSVWAAFGISSGLLCGDVLLALAFESLAESRTGALGLGELARTAVELGEGEAEDVAFERRPRAAPQEYAAMAAAKTGALMRCACLLGASAGGAEEERARELGAFGRHLGVAFQIADDLLGVFGDPRVTGKPVGSDLAARKKSLPVVAALCADGEAAQELADLFDRAGALGPTEVEHAAALVERAGGARVARREVTHRLALAHSALARALPAPAARRDLLALAHLLTHRDR
ncbi:polyprenyl synthetase family protein [Streptomyces sp. 891-h]|uniref:polyprenyl synthetase family protein n=1 Tax=Streptomyces sp. 891-h TaxID=2720714 RepID=UPI001FAB2889|nr:polyprenyl synthetase family protein [Streptomyces sp. 891-h]